MARRRAREQGAIDPRPPRCQLDDERARLARRHTAVAIDCFTRAGLSPVYATVDPDNAQSVAVVTKVPGARRIGVAGDEEVYELSAHE